MFLSGLIPRPMNADNDRELLGLGIGFTNIVERTTRASQELTRTEIEEVESILRIPSHILDEDNLRIWNQVCERDLHLVRQHNSGIPLLKQNIMEQMLR